MKLEHKGSSYTSIYIYIFFFSVYKYKSILLLILKVFGLEGPRNMFNHRYALRHQYFKSLLHHILYGQKVGKDPKVCSAVK